MDGQPTLYFQVMSGVPNFNDDGPDPETCPICDTKLSKKNKLPYCKKCRTVVVDLDRTATLEPESRDPDLDELDKFLKDL